MDKHQSHRSFALALGASFVPVLAKPSKTCPTSFGSTMPEPHGRDWNLLMREGGFVRENRHVAGRCFFSPEIGVAWCP